MRQLFRLVRCGRLEAARQLCHEVGQPWRAASLGSGGGLGLIPLGAPLSHANKRQPSETSKLLRLQTPEEAQMSASTEL